MLLDEYKEYDWECPFCEVKLTETDEMNFDVDLECLNCKRKFIVEQEGYQYPHLKEIK